MQKTRPLASKPALKIPSADAMRIADAKTIAVITELAAAALKLEQEMKQLNERLDVLNKAHWKLASQDLPLAMTGLTEVTTTDGTKVVVTNYVTGNIKEQNREKAHAWLRKNGFGSLIKTDIAASFGMGEDKTVEKLVTTLLKQKIPFTSKEAVNTNTLKAFVRERLTAKKALPPSIDYTSVPTVKITPRKSNHG